MLIQKLYKWSKKYKKWNNNQPVFKKAVSKFNKITKIN